MALNDLTVGYDGVGPTLAAPTTTETIAAPDDHTALLVVIGGTPTTITLVRPGTDNVGVAVPDKAIGPLSNTTRLIKVDRNYRDPATGDATVQFSQVTGVTASVVRTR